MLTVTGVVLSVEGPNAAQVDTFSLRTAAGEVIDFEVGRLDLDQGGLPAPHLREHLVDSAPISVDYMVDNGRNVALRYVDAE